MEKLKKNIFLTAVIGASLMSSSTALAALNIGEKVNVCASAEEAQLVSETYKIVTGAPLPVVARIANLPEVRVATGLPKGDRYAVKSSPDIVKKLWRSIDAWGANTDVRMVFTMGGDHVLDFPGKVPVTQKDLDDGWIDIYADGGKGVHGHLWLDRIETIHAIDIPGADGVRTRSISFYGLDGKLILGLYASISTKVFDQKAVDGFEKTKRIMSNMPQLCQ